VRVPVFHILNFNFLIYVNFDETPEDEGGWNPDARSESTAY